jgi:tripartite-type tricarboxylate transporter receptor subunit TctC
MVPYVPGGGTDIFARRLSQPLARELGQEIIVENQGGAGGNIGMKNVVDATPDGYTIVLALSAQLALNPSLYANMSWDPVKDLEPVTLLGEAPYILVTNPKFPPKDIPELIKYVKEHPGEVSFASAGVGSMPHLAGELLNTEEGLDMEHIPYQGGGAVYPDLISGRLQLYFATVASSIGYIKENRLNAIAVGSKKPLSLFPDLKPVADTVPGFEATVWYAVLAPKGTPRPIVDKLNKAFIAAMKDPSLSEALKTDMIQVIGSTPEELGSYVQSEIKKWAPVVKASGARLN